MQSPTPTAAPLPATSAPEPTSAGLPCPARTGAVPGGLGRALLPPRAAWHGHVEEGMAEWPRVAPQSVLMLPTEPFACRYQCPEDRRSTIHETEVDTESIRMSSLRGAPAFVCSTPLTLLAPPAEWGLGARPSPRALSALSRAALQPHRRQGATARPVLQTGALRLGEAYLDQRHTACKRLSPGRIRISPDPENSHSTLPSLQFCPW